VSQTEHLARAAALIVAIALPCVAMAQQAAPNATPITTANPDAAAPSDASTLASAPAPSISADAGTVPSADRIVLRSTIASGAAQPATRLPALAEPVIDEFRRPGPGRAPVRLEHSSAERAEFLLIPSEDDIPLSLRRNRTPAPRALCRGNCLLYVPTSRTTRVSARTDGVEVSTELTPTPEGLRVSFQQPSRSALVAAYALYPTAALLGIAGAITAVLVQDPGARLGSAVGLFSGATLVLGAGIATNAFAFAGTVRTQPLVPTRTNP